jgi:hypothetical protein
MRMKKPAGRIATMAALVAALLPAPAQAADSASGAFQCDAQKIPVRGAVARWEPATRKLVLTLFQSPPTPEAIQHWTSLPSGAAAPAPRGLEHFARITYTLSGSGAVNQAAIANYQILILCPTLQATLTRLGEPDRDMKADFPSFHAMLAPGGRLRTAARGGELLKAKGLVQVTWDVRVDAEIHVK